MKLRFCAAFALLLLVSGCGDGSAGTPDGSSQSTNAASSQGSLVTAPVEYLGAISKGQQSAVKTIDLAAVNQAIQLFQTEQSRLHNDLEELVREGYLVRIPATPYGTKLTYDHATGEAKVVKQ